MHAALSDYVHALQTEELCRAQTALGDALLDDASACDPGAHLRARADYSNASRVVRLQKGRSADGKFEHVATFTLDRTVDAVRCLCE